MKRFPQILGNKGKNLKRIEREHPVRITIIDGHTFLKIHPAGQIEPALRTDSNGELIDHVVRIEITKDYSEHIKTVLEDMGEKCLKMNWKWFAFNNEDDEKPANFYDQFYHNKNYYSGTDFMPKNSRRGGNPYGNGPRFQGNHWYNKQNSNNSQTTTLHSSHSRHMSGNDNFNLPSPYPESMSTNNTHDFNIDRLEPGTPHNNWGNLDSSSQITQNTNHLYDEEDADCRMDRIINSRDAYTGHMPGGNGFLTGVSAWETNPNVTTSHIPTFGGKKPKKPYQGKKPKNLPPKKNNTLAINKSKIDTKVIITMNFGDNIGCIAVQQPTHPSYQALPSLEMNLWHYYDKDGENYSPHYFEVIHKSAKIGSYCVVKTKLRGANQQKYHRAKIHAMLSMDDEVEVQFMDWGGFDKYHRSEVYTFLSEDCQVFKSFLPFQATALELVDLIATNENTLSLAEEEEIKLGRSRKLITLAGGSNTSNLLTDSKENVNTPPTSENHSENGSEITQLRDRTSTVISPTPSSHAYPNTPSPVSDVPLILFGKDIIVRTNNKNQTPHFSVPPVDINSIIPYEEYKYNWANYHEFIYTEIVREVATPEISMSGLAKQYARIYTRNRYTDEKFYIDMQRELEKVQWAPNVPNMSLDASNSITQSMEMNTSYMMPDPSTGVSTHMEYDPNLSFVTSVDHLGQPVLAPSIHSASHSELELAQVAELTALSEADLNAQVNALTQSMDQASIDCTSPIRQLENSSQLSQEYQEPSISLDYSQTIPVTINKCINSPTSTIPTSPEPFEMSQSQMTGNGSQNSTGTLSNGLPSDASNNINTLANFFLELNINQLLACIKIDEATKLFTYGGFEIPMELQNIVGSRLASVVSQNPITAASMSEVSSPVQNVQNVQNVNENVNVSLSQNLNQSSTMPQTTSNSPAAANLCNQASTASSTVTTPRQAPDAYSTPNKAITPKTSITAQVKSSSNNKKMRTGAANFIPGKQNP